jgi:hypothetical protein
MPLRLLLYAVLYWERQWQIWATGHAQREPLRLSPVVPIVFHTGPDPWRRRSGLADLFEAPEALRPFIPQWPLLYWDITDHSPQELLDSVRQWFQALAVVRAEAAEPEGFPAVLAEALRRLETLSQSDPVRWKELLWFLLSWALRRRPPNEHDATMRLVESSQTQASIRQEVEAMSQTVQQTWEQWMLEQGEAKGKILAKRETLRDLLEERFGPLPEAVAQRVEAITDFDRLRALLRQVVHIQALDELQL